jgi:hypothetical protein
LDISIWTPSLPPWKSGTIRALRGRPIADFTTKTRVVTLEKSVVASDAAARETIQFQALRLFMPFLDRRENPKYKAIRLLGVKVERLE